MGSKDAFGIGALEEDDDLVVYERTDRSQYNFHVDGLKDDAAEAAGVISVRALKSQKDTNADAAPDRDACVGACSDGMPPLASFIVAAHSVAKGTWYGVVDCHLHR